MNARPLAIALLLLALSPALVSSARADDTPPRGPSTEIAEAPTVAYVRANSKLIVARNGTEVNIRWELPDVEVRGVELIRNTRKETKGRTRIASVSKKTIQYIDAVPDASATYWYWLKITLKDGATAGIGPVPTPDAEVWKP